MSQLANVQGEQLSLSLNRCVSITFQVHVESLLTWAIVKEIVRNKLTYFTNATLPDNIQLYAMK